MITLDSHIGTYRDLRQGRYQSRAQADARARTILRRGALRHMDVHVALLVEVRRNAQALRAAARTTVSAAVMDSAITSPSEPVLISWPLPGTTAVPMVSSSPPTWVQARPVT